MLVNKKCLSFREFYFLKESTKEDVKQKIINTLNEIKSLISDKISDVSKSTKLNQLKKDLINYFKELKKLGSSVVKNLLNELIVKPFIKVAKMEGRKGGLARFFVAFLPHLIAAIGMYEYYNIRHIDEPSIEVKPSYSIQKTPSEESEKLTQDIIKELEYGRFSDRVNFVEKIKTYEVGPKKVPLKAYSDRTQTSIGYGTKANEGESELSVTDAHDRLINELSSIEQELLNYLKSRNLENKFNKDQISGMVDFSFNRGINKFKKLMNTSRNLKELTDKMKLEVGARTSNTEKPKVSKGLIDRRNFESNLILKNVKLSDI